MASKTEICNLALSHLGIGKEISNIDTDTSEEGSACRRFYDTVRDGVLRQIQWPFSRKFRDLSLIEEEPTSEWAYSYRYPSDCLDVRRIISPLRKDNQDSRIEYIIGQDDSGLIIYCDEADAAIEYTVRSDTPSKYPPDFMMALSLRLAFYIAPRLTKGDPFGLRQVVSQMYGAAIRDAAAASFNEQEEGRLPESEFIRGRD